MELQQTLILIHSDLQARRSWLEMSLKQYFIFKKVAVREILVQRVAVVPCTSFTFRFILTLTSRTCCSSAFDVRRRCVDAYKQPCPKSDPLSLQSDSEYFVPTPWWPCLCFAPSQLSFISTTRGGGRGGQKNQTFKSAPRATRFFFFVFFLS